MAEKSIEAINTKHTSPSLSINEITCNRFYKKQTSDTNESPEVEFIKNNITITLWPTYVVN